MSDEEAELVEKVHQLQKAVVALQTEINHVRQVLRETEAIKEVAQKNLKAALDIISRESMRDG